MNLRRHLIAGTIASVIIMIASWGVGWLPSSQLSWFAGSTLLNPLRVDTAGVITCAILLVLGGLGLVRAWLRLGQELRLARSAADSARTLRRAAICWTAPLVLALPIFSRDVYSYLAQGRILHSGLSPYETGVSAVPNWFSQGADSIWAESPSPYGPLFLLLARAVWFLCGGVPETGVLAFRLISLAGMVLCWYTVPRLARRFGAADANWALWIAVLNPLFLLYLIAGVHNDSVMLGLLLAGFLLLDRYQPARQNRRRWWARTLAGLALITASIAIKPLTVLALPFAGLMLVADRDNTRPRYRHRAAAWMLCVLVAGVLLSLIGAVSGLWFGWVPAMLTSGDAAFPYAPYGLLGLGVGWVAETLIPGAQSGAVASNVYTLGTIISCAVVAWLALKRQIIHPMRAVGISLMVAVLLAPIIQPWYLLWVLPLFAVVRHWRAWIDWVLYLLILGLVVVGVVDQLSVAQWIPALTVRVLTAAIGILAMILLVLVDPQIRKLFPFRSRTRTGSSTRPSLDQEQSVS